MLLPIPYTAHSQCRNTAAVQQLETLASNDFDPHAWVSRPRRCVKLDISRYERIVHVRVMHRKRIRITFEHLRITTPHRRTILSMTGSVYRQR